MIRAFIVGCAILLLADGAWLIALRKVEVPEGASLLLWASVLVSALACAYLAPHKKILLGTSIAIPAAIFAGLSNFAFELSGNRVDLGGFPGALIVAVMAFPFHVVLCLVGAIAAHLLQTARKRDARG